MDVAEEREERRRNNWKKNRQQNRWTSSKEKQKMIRNEIQKEEELHSKRHGTKLKCAVFDWITFLFRVVSFNPHPHAKSLSYFFLLFIDFPFICSIWCYASLMDNEQCWQFFFCSAAAAAGDEIEELFDRWKREREHFEVLEVDFG